MSGVVALGTSNRIRGFALAGVATLETDATGADEAWSRLPEDTSLLLLTEDAARALADRLAERPMLLWTVIPT